MLRLQTLDTLTRAERPRSGASRFAITLGLTLVALVALTGAAAAQPAQLYFSPPSTTVDCNGNVSVDVMIDDITDLQGFSLYVNYNPNVVSVGDLSVAAGPDLVAACTKASPFSTPIRIRTELCVWMPSCLDAR